MKILLWYWYARKYLIRACIKIWAAMNSMNYTYGRSKTLIVQRLQTIQRQLQQALQDFGKQSFPQCLSEMNPPLGFTTLSAMVTAVVRKGQH
ncbi:unnamed protein product [Rotaria sp. Silwood1]|nr:unnamed protein product [Rotaria sp. Silwood1]